METFGGNVGGGVDQKSSRARHGKWKHNSNMSPATPEPEIVIPLDGGVLIDPEKPKSKYAEKKRGIPSSSDGVQNERPKRAPRRATRGQSPKVAQPEAQDEVEIRDIPEEILANAEEVLKGGKRGWVNTPGPIKSALKAAGFSLSIDMRGTLENEGDVLSVSRNGERTLLSTNEAADLLQKIIIKQRDRLAFKAMSQGTQNDSLVISKSEVGTPPNAQGEELQPNGVVGEDSKVEDHNIPAPDNIVEGEAENDIPVLTDVDGGVNFPTTTEEMSQQVLAERALRIAQKREEILGRKGSGSLVPHDSGIDAPAHTDVVPSNGLEVSTIGGEVVRGSNPTERFKSGDAGIEDAEILREVPKPNIGKSRESGDSVEVGGEKDVPMLTDATKETIPSAIPEISSDESFSRRIEEIARQQAEKFGISVSEEKAGKALGTSKTETEVPPVNVDAEKPREEAPVAPERPRVFDARFETEFGVTKEMWEKIPGHEKLSSAQQKLVFINLSTFVEREKTPYLSKVWEGIREKLSIKKDVGPVLATLTQLVGSTAEYGPKVHEDEKGNLLTDFVGLGYGRENRLEMKTAMDSLNDHAHRLALTPASWQEDGIGTHSEDESKVMSLIKDKLSPSRKRYNAYKEIQKGYEDAKKELSKVLTKEGFTEDKIVERLVDIDKNVYMLQFQQTSPDAVEAVKNIPDADMWKKIGQSLYNHKDKFGYAALGFVGRTALAGAAGVLAAPTANAAVGGYRAWNKSAAEIRERDRAARMGVRDSSKEALNIVSAEMTMKVGKEKYEVGATQKLQYLIDKYNTLKETYDIEEPPSPEYIKDMNALLESIRVRASYVEDKQRLNRISFGDREERPAQMANLYRTLATAQMIVADNRDFPKTKEELPKWRSSPVSLEKNLADALSKTEDKLQNKRRARQVKDASKGAFIAGVSSYVGASIATHLQEFGFMEKPSESLTGSSLSENTPSSAQNLVAPEGVGSETYPFAEDAPMNPNAMDFPYAEEAPMSPNAMNFPYAEEAPAMNGVSETLTKTEVGPNAFGSYEIQRGDTLTKILKEQMPEIKELGKGPAQENALANILRGLTPEEMKEIGIRSGNPNLIYAGDKIDMDALHKIVESRSSVIEGAVSRFGAPVDAVTEVAPQSPVSASVTEVAPSSVPVTPEVAPSGASVTPEARATLTPEALGTEQYAARYELGSRTNQDLENRKEIITNAKRGISKWMNLYPDIEDHEMRDAAIMEAHFKSLLGGKDKMVYGISAKNFLNFLNNESGIALPDSSRAMFEFNKLAETVAQSPMRVVPKPGEGVEAFLERACVAYAQEAKNLPPIISLKELPHIIAHQETGLV